MPDWTEEQLLAINEDNKSIIVSAGAGSGKTAVLTERVIRKIMDKVSLNELLVLTFTNAAAREMRERIREKLVENNMQEALDMIDTASITTFDAYALSLVKKYSHLLNVDKDINICEESIIKIRKKQIMDDVFENLYSDELFKKFIADFSTKDDKEIKKWLLKISEKLDLMYDKNAYLNSYINEFYSYEKVNQNILEYLNLINEKIDNLEDYLKELKKYASSEFYEKMSIAIKPILDREYSNEEIKLPSSPRNSDPIIKEMRKSIKKQIDNIIALGNNQNIDILKEEIFTTKDNAMAIIKILTIFENKLDEYKKEHNFYEFSDVAKMAIKLVREHPEIKEELKYNEILIDEYQDTSDLQEEFIKEIENNNVYMVGDIKQSIYRFRNANPDLFKKKYDTYGNDKYTMKIDLNKNFRSREEVLNNINMIFNDIMTDRIGGANYTKSHQLLFGSNIFKKFISKKDSNMEIIMYEENDEYDSNEQEIFLIANDIKNKIKDEMIYDKEIKQMRPINYSDISILLDRSTDFDLYKKIFEYMQIPVTLYEDQKITNSIEISLLKNIIGFLTTDDELEKRYAFTSILRSYLFNMDDNYIFASLMNNDYSYLDNYLVDTFLYTPYEITSYIIDKFNFYEKIITVGNIENRLAVLEYLLDLSRNLTDIGYDLTDYYNYLKEVIDSDDIEIRFNNLKGESNSVKIMTIHKSKGLEYPICYYGGLTKQFTLDDIKNRIVFDNKYGIVLPSVNNGFKDTFYKILLKEKYIKEEVSEKTRLFYVALTRAKEKVVMVLPSKEAKSIPLNDNVRASYRSFSDMLYSVYDKLSHYIKPADNSIYTHDYDKIKKSNYASKIKANEEVIDVKPINIVSSVINVERFSKDAHKLYSKEEYDNIEYGKHIHSVFENIDFNNPDYSLLNNHEKEKVQRLLNNDIFREVKNIYKEYEFIDQNGNHGFIDLLLEYDNEYKIVDYKLKNIQDDAYLKQLDGYKKYIESITNKKTKTYLYSIIDNKLVEL